MTIYFLREQNSLEEYLFLRLLWILNFLRINLILVYVPEVERIKWN